MADLPLETLVKGTQSAQARRAALVACNPEEYRRVWERIYGGQEGAAPLPVDFSRSMVLAAFQGMKPTAGYGIEIARIADEGDAVKVYLHETEPGLAFVAQVLTAPYHVVRTAKVEKPVIFMG